MLYRGERTDVAIVQLRNEDQHIFCHGQLCRYARQLLTSPVTGFLLVHSGIHWTTPPLCMACARSCPYLDVSVECRKQFFFCASSSSVIVQPKMYQNTYELCNIRKTKQIIEISVRRWNSRSEDNMPDDLFWELLSMINRGKWRKKRWDFGPTFWWR